MHLSWSIRFIIFFFGIFSSCCFSAICLGLGVGRCGSFKKNHSPNPSFIIYYCRTQAAPLGYRIIFYFYYLAVPKMLFKSPTLLDKLSFSEVYAQISRRFPKIRFNICLLLSDMNFVCLFWFIQWVIQKNRNNWCC